LTAYTDNFSIDTRDPGEYLAALKVLKFEKLRKQIAYVFTNEGYYKQRFLEAGVTAPEDIRSLNDFWRLPTFLDKQRLRESQEQSLEHYGYPFGLHLTAPLETVVHFAATSGTTGQPTFYAFTKRNLATNHKIMARAFRLIGLKPGDTTMHAFGLSLWLAGFTFAQALEEYGARPVAVGAAGGIPKILCYIQHTRPRALFATPWLVSQLIERAPDEIGMPVRDLGIEFLFCTGEPGVGLSAFRERVTEAYGARVFDFTGGAWHNSTVSCGSKDYHGMHYMAEDYCFRYDLVDPVSREPIAVRDGAVGEAIHTGLEYEAAPAFRNATGDILKLDVGECPGCGRFGIRMSIVGRADDMLNVKGVKVYPSALQDVAQMFEPRASGRRRMRLDGPPPRVEPPLKLVVEAGAGLAAADWPALEDDIAQRCREILAIRPKVTVVPFGALPRSNQKTELIEIAG
jgi:phenylacetate-CoA ligase